MRLWWFQHLDYREIAPIVRFKYWNGAFKFKTCTDFQTKIVELGITLTDFDLNEEEYTEEDFLFQDPNFEHHEEI